MTQNTPAAAFWRDRLFWLSVAVAPLVWVLLWLVLGVPLTWHSSKAILVLGLTILVYPVLEEIVFRGLLQGWLLDFKPLTQRFCGLTLANVITSVVFTGLHFINQSPLWAASVIVPSLIFGWARDRFGSIRAPIILHIFYNAGFILLFG